MARKATHYGTCQVCGRKQKLPNGLLSLHGYTTRWGFFSGVCPGSDSLPFEQSINLIDDMIFNSQQAAAALQEQAAEYLAGKRDDQFFKMRYYRPGRPMPEGVDRQTGKIIARFTLAAEKSQYGDHMIAVERWASDNEDTGTRHYMTFEATLEYVRKLHAQQKQGLAKQRLEYVEWQQARIKDWKPSELTPVDGVNKQG